MLPKMDVAVMGIVCVIFALTAFYWVNSLGYRDEINNQRQHAIEFLQQHQFDMAIVERNQVMDKYGITFEDLQWLPK